MLKLALRGLVAHKARLAATAVAVILGVGFVSGTYVLTDTLKAAITGVIGQTQTNVAVQVQARSHLSQGGALAGLGSAGLAVPASLVDKVGRVRGVRAAEGVVAGSADVVRPDGTALSKSTTLDIVLNVGNVPALRALELRQGRFPTTADQAVIDAGTASRADLALGQQLRVAGGGAAHTVTLVGIVGYGAADSIAGATLVGLTLPAAQSVLGEPGKLSEVVASAQPGVSSSALRQRVAAALGRAYKVQTQRQAEASITGAINKGFSIFGDILLVFAGVALFVAIFLIFNTFSILLAQRSRELALLRCLGAFRRQVAVSVLAEALGVGVIASVLGLGLGVLLALGIKAVLGGVGVSFPAASPVIETRTVIVSLLVGTLATLVAAALPAIRGSRTPPVTALRAELSVDGGRTTPLRLGTGLVFGIVGILVVVGSLHSGGSRLNAANRAEVAGIGLVLVFLALAALVPVIARRSSEAIGWPFAKISGIAGEIGRRNAMRHPRRTASTASALMIGLTLVTTIGVFSRSAEVSTDASLQSGLSANFVLTPNSAAGVSTEVGATLGRLPQVRDVASLSTDRVKVDVPGHSTKRVSVAGTDVRAWAKDVDLPVSAGRLSAVSGHTVAVTAGVAQTWHLAVGDQVPLTSDQVSRVPFTVAAIFRDPTGLTGDLLVAQSGYAALFPQQAPSVSMILARTAPGVSLKTSTGALYLQTTSQFPQVKLYTKAGYIANVNQQINQLIGIISALLGLAVVIALFGIVNTLALSIVERRREIGLLRALGMSRAQLRATIRWESVIVSLFGTLLGVAVGLVFGWVVVDALRADGLSTFAVPVDELVIFVVLAAVAGVIAAVIPARTAAKVDVLEAIAAE